VDGLNLSLVDVTFCGKFPVFAVTQDKYISAAVVVSSVIAVLVALVAVPDVAAFKLATCVVEATVSGAVPVRTVDVMTPVAETVVNAPEFAVVAPTVPLMLMDAVPVKLVTVPLDGVPNTPPLTTKAPAVPVFTPRAVTTPVPVVVVAGATPAPPPKTIAFAANAADVAQPVALVK
jgi:hypothetical protein